MSQVTRYEDDRTLAQYLEFHFGESWHGESNFPRELADAAMDAMDGRLARKALDIGCACGRTALELARHFGHVDAVDYSGAFIDAGTAIAREGVVRYERVEEGELVSYQQRSLAALGLAEHAHRVAFRRGDACDLPGELSGYDLVIAGNLIDRLYSPRAFLESMKERVSDLGLLVIASPYTWMEEYTPREEWLGGYLVDGKPYTTLDGLRECLIPDFRLLVEPRSLPFVIRETRNKYQHSFSEITVWEKLPA